MCRNLSYLSCIRFSAFVDDESNETGHAYIFSKTGTSWAQAAKIDAPGESYFGHSVSLGNRVAAIGTYGYSYIFTQANDGSWTEYDKLANGEGEFWMNVAVQGSSVLSTGGGSAHSTEYVSLSSIFTGLIGSHCSHLLVTLCSRSFTSQETCRWLKNFTTMTGYLSLREIYLGQTQPLAI